jgi:prepilin-type N-terminal cleavage/methylation domain-containing protein
MLDYTKTRNRDRGFTVLELVIVVAVALVLAAIAVPRVMSIVSDISLRYAATDMSGLLQTARIQAIKKNTFFGVQPTVLSNNATGYYVNVQPGGTYVVGDPLIPIDQPVTISQGTGAGAPGEAGFEAGLGYGFAAAAVVPSFNARGLPCSPAAGICAQNAGVGFIIFMKRTGNVGDDHWAAVVVTPSGRAQVWTCDTAGNWIQR